VKQGKHLFNATLCLLFSGLCSEAADLKLPVLTGNSAGTVGNAGAAPDDEKVLGGWVENAPIPTKGGLSQTTIVATDAGLIYIIGGGVGSGPDARVDQLLAYEPSSDTYSTFAPIPVSDGISAFGAAAVIGTNIYVFGGVSGVPSHILQSLWIYDTVNDLWSAGADMPAPRYGSAVGVVNGQIIIAGGATAVIETTTWIYEPGSNSYTTVASMPDGFPTYRIHGVGLSDRGVAGQFRAYAGGLDSRAGVGHFIYDVATDSWSLGSAMPFAVTDPGVATFGSNVYVTGGTSRLDGRLQIFNLDSNTWSQGPTMLGPVNNTSATVTADGVIYNIGGHDGSNPLATNQSTAAP
jgi:hypothetical protein